MRKRTSVRVSTSRKQLRIGRAILELTVPQTDTGEQVEYTRALERTMLKEREVLARPKKGEERRKNDPVTSGEGVLSLLSKDWESGTYQGVATVY